MEVLCSHSFLTKLCFQLYEDILKVLNFYFYLTSLFLTLFNFLFTFKVNELLSLLYVKESSGLGQKIIFKKLENLLVVSYVWFTHPSSKTYAIKWHDGWNKRTTTPRQRLRQWRLLPSNELCWESWKQTEHALQISCFL